MLNSIMVEKKDHTHEKFNMDKVIKAVNKSARRSIRRKFNAEETAEITKRVSEAVIALDKQIVSYEDMHAIIETTLADINDKVCAAYKDYRNWREHHLAWDELYQKSQSIRYRGDKDNSNSDSSLVSTKCSLIYHQYNKELYQRYFLTPEELEDCKAGYYYIHDMVSRLDTMNCCLFDIQSVLKGGFEMGNIGYTEPHSLDVAFDVIGDIVLCAASQQYGGFTLPEIDTVLAPYAQKSYDKYLSEEMEFAKSIMYAVSSNNMLFVSTQTDLCNSQFATLKDNIKKLCSEKAEAKVRRDFEQGFQGWENKFNTVASSRGDYPFITITTGHDTSHFGLMSSEVLFEVRKEGQGKPGFKHVVPFPKIVFLYDEALHGKGAPYEWLFDKSIECSQKAMYPDYLSLTGDGYVPSMYKKYGKIVSPMGCRAFLSPWYERGGMYPADENDTPIFIGRFNMGAISLNLPLIYAKALEDKEDFFEVLDSYLEKIRELHLRTIEYLGDLRASINPLAFCEGGFYGGHLKHTDKIKPLLKSATASFGFTALNELQELYNQKSLVEDGEFAVKVMQHINDKVNEFKKEDHVLYAIYGAPAESLCFSGDTEVQTYNGYTPIKDIKVGDLVYTYNEEKEKIELKEVLASFMTSPAAKVVKIKTTNGQEIICTPNHPFATADGGEIDYTIAEELKPGTLLKSSDDTLAAVYSNEPVEEEIPVYNLTVEDNHNYFIKNGNSSILVHNCGLQVKQFRAKYGIIKGVSDRDYVSNSFHCHVTEDITGIQKQDLENRFWNLANGGKIQYVRYPVDYNFEACKSYVRRAMKLGFYEGINLSLAYCDDCGHSELGMDKCTKCGSTNLTKIDRMNGYLSYSRVKGDTRLNDAKMAEIADRKSM